MRTEKLVCPVCNVTFDKYIGELNRIRAKKRNCYCGPLCAATVTGNVANFGDKRNTSTAHLDPANRRDEFSEFRYYERKARFRKPGSTITLGQLKEVWERQEGKCAYTGIPLRLYSAKKVRGLKPWEYASLDRINSDLPYIEGNVQFLCTNLNYMKSTLSEDDTRSFIDLIRNSKFPNFPNAHG